MTIREWIKSLVVKFTATVRRWFRVYPYKIGNVEYLAPGHIAIGNYSPPRIGNFNWTPRPRVVSQISPNNSVTDPMSDPVISEFTRKPRKRVGAQSCLRKRPPT